MEIAVTDSPSANGDIEGVIINGLLRKPGLTVFLMGSSPKEPKD
jgi:hypothetical protein